MTSDHLKAEWLSNKVAMRKRRDMAIYNRFVSDPSRLTDLAKEYKLTTKRTVEIINKYHHIVYGVLDDE